MTTSSVQLGYKLDLDKWAKQVITRHLKPGEELLWSERGINAKREAAEHLRLFMIKQLLVVIGIVFTIAFGIGYVLSGMLGVFKVIGEMFCVALTFGSDYLCLVSPIGYLFERERFYGITPERIIIVYASSSLACISIYPENLCAPLSTSYDSGRGEILVAKDFRPYNKHAQKRDMKLIGLRDFSAVEKLIRETFSINT